MEIKNTSTKVDIDRMSKETRISISKIKNVLGIPPEPHPALTLEEARKAFSNAPLGSETRNAALQKWHQFSAEAVKQAKTLEEIRKAYYNTHSGSEEERAAIRKIATFFQK